MSSLGFNGTIMTQSLPVRAMATIPVLFCLQSALLGCEISSSGTDREKQAKISAELDRQDRVLARVEEKERRAWRAFTARYKGQVKPGVGCSVCPELCEVADLGPMGGLDFQQEYRQMVVDLTESHESHRLRVAMHEHRRLICVLQNERVMLEALMPLLTTEEMSAVRYHAAIDLAEVSHRNDESRRVLQDVARGSDFTAGLARVRIEKWDKKGWPGE